MEKTDALPLACNPHALTPAEWASHQATAATLFSQTIVPPAELPDGYSFLFPVSALPTVATFVDGERRCCPFLRFTIAVPPGEAPVELRITGTVEAKAVIAAELLGQAP